MASIVPPAPNNEGSRESSEFEFVGKGNATKNEDSAPANILTNIGIPVDQPQLVTVQAKPVVETFIPTSPIAAASLPPGIPETKMETAILLPTPSKEIDETSPVSETKAAQASSGMFGWVRGTGILSKVVEKTRSVTENVITTLDPQMKDFIHSGGDIQIVVASDKDDKVLPIREAFQNVFGQATIVGLPSKANTIAEQPVGYASGKQAALERISSLRKSGSVLKETVVISVENFLYEVSENIWIDMSCLILSDPVRKVQLQTYSQPTNVPVQFIKKLKESTPQDYPKRWSGFSTPIGGVVAAELNVAPSEWQAAVSGVSRRRLLLLAGEGLAGMYHRHLQAKVDEV